MAEITPNTFISVESLIENIQSMLFTANSLQHVAVQTVVMLQYYSFIALLFWPIIIISQKRQHLLNQ